MSNKRYGPYVAILVSLALFAGVLASDRAVTTNIKDAYPIAHWLEGVDQKVKPKDITGFNLAPGYYRVTIQSYCLHAGTYAPTKGDGYLLAPLKGDRAGLIRSILQRSPEHSDVPQQDIQRLIWGIEADASFRDYPPDFQARVRPLLTPEEIAAMSAEKSVKSALDRFAPRGVTRALDFYGDLRRRVTDAQTSYQQLEEMAVRTGAAPEGKDSRKVDPGNWNYAGDNFYMRTYPTSYPTTAAEILVPACYRLERDDRSRLRVLESGPYRIEAAYDDGSLGQGRAWRFRSLRFSGPGGAFTIQDAGWMVSSAAASYGGGRRGSLDRPPAPDNQSNGYLQLISYDARAEIQGPSPGEIDARIRDATNRWDQLNRYRGEWKRGGASSDQQAAADLTDLTHFVAALESLGQQAEFQRRGDLSRDYLLRVLAAWTGANCVVSGDCPGIVPSRGGDCSRVFDPTSVVSTPGNTAKQRLGLSARLKRQ
jgi:hypothetical protein